MAEQLFLTSHLLSAAGVAHGFSLRSAGDDARLLAEAASIEGEIATVRQVHGDRIVAAGGKEVFAASEEQPEGADALVALAPGVAAGVPQERIEQVAGCTSCDVEAFFSHRRDKGRTGRHLAFIAAQG